MTSMNILNRQDIYIITRFYMILSKLAIKNWFIGSQTDVLDGQVLPFFQLLFRKNDSNVVDPPQSVMAWGCKGIIFKVDYLQRFMILNFIIIHFSNEIALCINICNGLDLQENIWNLHKIIWWDINRCQLFAVNKFSRKIGESVAWDIERAEIGKACSSKLWSDFADEIVGNVI